MLRRGQIACSLAYRRSYSGSAPNPGYRLAIAARLSAGLGALIFSSTLFNDSIPIGPSSANASPKSEIRIGELDTFAWGSNQYRTLSPDDPKSEMKSPTTVPELSGTAFRDIALHNKHAALVDVRGDIYQWGNGFFDISADGSDKRPRLTLRGKNISQIALSDGKVFALSKTTGKIYVLSSSSSRQRNVDSPRDSSWNYFSFLLSPTPQNIDVIELKPDSNFGRNERFTSISAGADHLVALTSSGRTFSYPITLRANTYGQLGYSKIESGPSRTQVELIPKIVSDPFANSTKYIRPSKDSPPTTAESIDDASIRFCDTIFEIPSLKGVAVSQAVAGERASYVITQPEGRVLAWGANQFGQLGLGSTMTLESVLAPTEVDINKSIPRTTRSKCSSISAGKDIAYFIVERRSSIEKNAETVDVLSCGMGQYGALGNNLYSQSQGDPVKIKSLSGLLEFDELTQSLQPLRPYSISTSSHTLFTLDTGHRGTAGGRDLFVWGSNQEYQLGTKSRSNSPTPLNISPLPDAIQDEPQAMLKTKSTAKAGIKDLQGEIYAKGAVKVEQCAVAGPGGSVVYWKIVDY